MWWRRKIREFWHVILFKEADSTETKPKMNTPPPKKKKKKGAHIKAKKKLKPMCYQHIKDSGTSWTQFFGY
jgi:hypothetical protein